MDGGFPSHNVSLGSPEWHSPDRDIRFLSVLQLFPIRVLGSRMLCLVVQDKIGLTYKEIVPFIAKITKTLTIPIL
jgi:hypothetical protein